MKQFFEKNKILIWLSAFTPGAVIAQVICLSMGVSSLVTLMFQLPLLTLQIFCAYLVIKYF